MPILETLVSTVGFAVAKGLLNVWLKDKPVIDVAGSDLLDALKTKTNDVLAARNGKRFFEELGDKVALSLRPIFEPHEFDLATFGSRRISPEAVALEVSRAIDSAHITQKLLASCNYDPNRLLSIINLHRPDSTNALSEAELALFNRALNVALQYIIDLASGLPDYIPTTFTEILQRIELSTEVLDNILERLNSLREASEQFSRPQFSEFEMDYRAAIARKLDRVNLFGADVSRNTKRYRLSVAYVSLDIIEHKPNDAFSSDNPGPKPRYEVDDPFLSPGDNQDSPEEFDDDFDDLEEFRISVEEALAKRRRYLIVGEAGSGKTTLLQWLAVNSATNSFERRMLGWRDTVPFFIELRRFADQLPAPEDFTSKILPEIAARMPQLWVHDLLKSGRALLLIDGLDEVPSDKRGAVHEWLESIVSTFPAARVVVTSRPASLESEGLRHLDFSELNLVPMSKAEVRLFVDYWHKAVLVEPDIESVETTKVMVDRLIVDIGNTVALSRLATNPLLCAMICALHYDRNMQLPPDRIALYEACCSMLLERRDVEREVRLEQFPRLNYKQKRVLLDDLAYWMLKNGYASVTVMQATDRMKQRLPNMQLSAASNPNSAEVVEMLIERSGIIRQPAPDMVDFIHRTFQEYMAAAAAISEDDWGLLSRNAIDDQWKETLILAVGLAKKKEANEFIDTLLHMDTETKEQRSYLDLLAISCLETAVEVSTEIRAEVESRLRAILPPRTRDHVSSLVAAGDLAVPHLIAKATYSEDESTACVQALTRIGTSLSLSKLGSFAPDTRPRVIAALDGALPQFLPEAVSNSGLADHLFASIGKFVEKDSISLSGNLILALSHESLPRWLEVIPSVRRLRITTCNPFCLYVVGAFPRTESLLVAGESLPDDLIPLGQMPRLSRLDLRNYGDKWPRFQMPVLKGVTTLRLMSRSEDWPKFYNEDFPNLTSLHVFSSFGDDLEEAEVVGNFPNLRHLHYGFQVGGLPPLSSAGELNSLVKLEISTVSGNFPLGMIGIDEMRTLREIIINVDKKLPSIVETVRELRDHLTGCQVKLRTGWSQSKW